MYANGLDGLDGLENGLDGLENGLDGLDGLGNG